MKQELIYDLLNRALEEEMGLVITTNNPHALNMHISAVKRDEPKYASLIITIPSTPETLIIAKRSVELDEPVYGEEDQ